MMNNEQIRSKLNSMRREARRYRRRFGRTSLRYQNLEMEIVGFLRSLKEAA